VTDRMGMRIRRDVRCPDRGGRAMLRAMDILTDARRVTTTDHGRADDARHDAVPAGLSTTRLDLMRAGYLLMAVGLAITKWPMLLQASTMPVMDGVVTAMLSAMAVLAFVGLRHPTAMLPLLVFESAWKVLWFVAIGIPVLAAGTADPQFGRIFASIALVVVILAVTPWDHVWARYVQAPGEPWR